MNNTNRSEKETEEDYNEIKLRYPQILISYFEYNFKIIHQKEINGNEQESIKKRISFICHLNQN